MGEREILEWLRHQQPGDGLDLPGDDAAILGVGADARALTTDQQIAGVHVPADLDPGTWARRLLAVNLSDLAAMGAAPEAALLTLAVPESFPVKRFLRAMVRACRAAGLTLAGGDMARAPVAVTSLTLVGRLAGGAHWVSRRAARPGDRIWLGATTGTSAAGQCLVARGARLEGRKVTLPPLKELAPVQSQAKRAVRTHLAPRPQLALGAWLARRRRASAIDISDGLALDLARLCHESKVGCLLEGAQLTPSQPLSRLADALNEDPIEWVLHGGEDYVLLFTLPPKAAPPATFQALEIGRITPDLELRLKAEPGVQTLDPRGWDHLQPRPLSEA